MFFLLLSGLGGQIRDSHNSFVSLHFPPLWLRKRRLRLLKCRDKGPEEPVWVLEGRRPGLLDTKEVSFGHLWPSMGIFPQTTSPLSIRLLRWSLNKSWERPTSSRMCWKFMGSLSLNILRISSSKGSILSLNMWKQFLDQSTPIFKSPIAPQIIIFGFNHVNMIFIL